MQREYKLLPEGFPYVLATQQLFFHKWLIIKLQSFNKLVDGVGLRLCAICKGCPRKAITSTFLGIFSPIGNL